MTPNGKQSQEQFDSVTTTKSIVTFVVVGAAFAAWAAWPQAPTALLWALACLASGGTLGFLFGVPRVLQATPESTAAASAAGARSALGVNTNLEQISDWVTKIIVGLGLVNLYSGFNYLDRIALYLASQLGPVAQYKAFAAALTLYFTALGFLAGYLITRISLSQVFRRADEASTALAQAEKRLTTMETDLNDVKRSLTQSPLPAAELAPLTTGLAPLTVGLAPPTAGLAEATVVGVQAEPPVGAGPSSPATVSGANVSAANVSAANVSAATISPANVSPITVPPAMVPPQIDPTLAGLLLQYANLTSRDPDQLGPERDRIAERIARLANERRLSLDELVLLQQDGALAAAAALVQLRPNAADIGPLLAALAGARHPHAQARLLNAVAALFSRQLVGKGDADRVTAAIMPLEKIADAGVCAALENVRFQISASRRSGES